MGLLILRSIGSARVTAIREECDPEKLEARAPNGLSPTPKNETASMADDPSGGTVADVELYKWIQARYSDSAFTTVGFIGWVNFREALQSEKPQQRSQIEAAIQQ